MSWAWRSSHPPQRPDQPDMPDGVCQLGPPCRLQMRDQVQLAAVICAVTEPAQRHDAQRVAAPAQRPRYQVRSINAVLG